MPEPESAVVRLLNQFRGALARREAAQAGQMVARWLQIEAALQGQITQLAAEIEAMRAAGQVITLGKLSRMERYKSLLLQTRRELGRFTEFAATSIAREQAAYANLGLKAATTTLDSMGLAGVFNRLPVSAVETIVGLAGDGTPLNKLLMKAWPDSVEGLTQALIKAIALGKAPRDTADAMVDGFGVGLNRAMLIARTEQLRAYRLASLAQYKESGVVKGWRWHAALDATVCPACMMLHGRLFELEPMANHPACRCAMIPETVSLEELGITGVKGLPPTVQEGDGQRWFEGLSEAEQRKMLGPGAYDAWKAGKFDLAALVKRHESEEWGASYGVRPLKELVSDAIQE